MAFLIQDVRYALRMLVRNPGFTVIAVLALGLGIGANTAIFSVVNSVLLRPLPFQDPDGLVMIWEKNIPRNRDRNVVSPANFLDWREQNQSFEQIAAYSFVNSPLNLSTANGEPERVMTSIGTAALFDVLGVKPMLGRPFTVADDLPNVPRVVMLSHDLWQRRFGGDASIVNQTIRLHGRDYIVVGVMPPRFSFPMQAECWILTRFDPADRTNRGRFLQVVGRLKPEATLQQAQAEMVSIAAGLEQKYAANNAGWTATVIPLTEQIVGDFRTALLVLLAAVAFVLLIACANIANLLLARATTRMKEIAIRTALGAGRRRVIRQLLTESVVLSMAGGVAGLVIAYWGTRAFVAMSPPNIPRLDEVALDGRALIFTTLISLATGVLFGLIPALQISRNLQTPLQESGKSSATTTRQWARNILVIAETAIAAMLLIGAGLLFASFLKLQGTSSGMNADNVLAVEINLPAAKYSETRQQTTFFHDVIERVKALPGVQAIGAISFLPLAGPGSSTGFTVEGRPAPAPGQGPVADVRAVSPDLFRAMGIRLLRGRVFDERDTANNKLAVVINQTAVNMYWPNEDPIGKTVNMPWFQPMIGEIVGIVEDVRLVTLDAAPRTTLYWNYLQFPYGSMNLVVRTANDPLQLAAAIRGELRAIDKDQPVANIRTMSDVLSCAVASPRFNTTLLLVFAGIALLLASVGIYGVMSFSVTQRTHEIGIRIALGARPAEVRRIVISHGMRLAVAGIAVGIAGSLALTRLMTTLLYQVKATDPGTFALVAAVLAVVAFLANYIPARRATRIDPLTALRHE